MTDGGFESNIFKRSLAGSRPNNPTARRSAISFASGQGGAPSGTFDNQSMSTPWVKFNAGEWTIDPRVTILSPGSRGVLFDLICVMHQRGSTGVLLETVEEFLVLARCSYKEFATFVYESGKANCVEFRGVGEKIEVTYLRMRAEYISTSVPSLRGWIAARRAKLLLVLTRRDGPGCRQCGTMDEPQIDHKKPLSRGGSNDLRNLQILCGTCNRRKHAKHEGGQTNG